MSGIEKKGRLCFLWSQWILPLLVTLTFSCVAEEEDPYEIPDGATIIAVGDSVMDWNRGEEASIPDVVGQELDRVAYNASVSGAYFTEGDDIPGQYVDGDWEWLVLDGGGNDFNDICECDCPNLMDEIIGEGGTSGALADFVYAIADQGVSVIILGYYYMPPTAEYGFANCNDMLDQYNPRQQLLADSHENVWFVDGRQIFGPDELWAYDDDHVHPSILGSQLIGAAIASQILSAEE